MLDGVATMFGQSNMKKIILLFFKKSWIKLFAKNNNLFIYLPNEDKRPQNGPNIVVNKYFRKTFGATKFLKITKLRHTQRATHLLREHPARNGYLFFTKQIKQPHSPLMKTRDPCSRTRTKKMQHPIQKNLVQFRITSTKHLIWTNANIRCGKNQGWVILIDTGGNPWKNSQPRTKTLQTKT